MYFIITTTIIIYRRPLSSTNFLSKYPRSLGIITVYTKIYNTHTHYVPLKIVALNFNTVVV